MAYLHYQYKICHLIMEQSFKFFTPRDKPKKRGARQHKKNKNKSEKRQKKQTRYKGQGKG